MKWAIRITIVLLVFLISVLSIRWITALQDRSQNSVQRPEGDSSNARITQLEQKMITPLPTVKPSRTPKRHIIKKHPRGLWDRIWNR